MKGREGGWRRRGRKEVCDEGKGRGRESEVGMEVYMMGERKGKGK